MRDSEEKASDGTPAFRRARSEMIEDAMRNLNTPEDWDENNDSEDQIKIHEANELDTHDQTSRGHVLTPDNHQMSITGVKSIGCLLGALALIAIAFYNHLPTPGLVVLWLGAIALAGGSVYLLIRLVEEHNREITVLLPGIGAAAGATVFSLIGIIADKNRGGVFAFAIAASLAALAYAFFYNRKHFGTGNAAAVTAIEAVFTPVAIALALLYVFRHDILRTVAPGVSTSAGRQGGFGKSNLPIIGLVTQHGERFTVYDNNNNRIGEMIFGGILQGYSSGMFHVKLHDTTYAFDARCRQLSSRINA